MTTTPFQASNIFALHSLLSQLNHFQKRELISFISSIDIQFCQYWSQIEDAINKSLEGPESSSSDTLQPRDPTPMIQPRDPTPMIHSGVSPNEAVHASESDLFSPDVTQSETSIRPDPVKTEPLPFSIGRNHQKSLIYSGNTTSKDDPSFIEYRGELQDGLFHGRGVFYSKPTQVAAKTILQKEGKFVHGRFTGGIMEYQNGNKYTGFTETDEKFNSVPHGNGEMQYNGGVWYKGDWDHGVYSGIGELNRMDLVYQGGFKNGHFEGAGILKRINPYTKTFLTYEGTFKEGEKHGKFQLHYQGFTYTSSFTKGIEDDSRIEAISSTKPTIVIKGPCKKNSFQFYGQCHVTFEDSFYQGFVNKAMFDCEGTMEWTSGPLKGMKYAGTWSSHHFRHGTLYYPDGAKYYGYFNGLNERSDEYGTMTYPDGQSVTLNFYIDPKPQEPKFDCCYSDLIITIPKLNL